MLILLVHVITVGVGLKVLCVVGLHTDMKSMIGHAGFLCLIESIYTFYCTFVLSIANRTRSMWSLNEPKYSLCLIKCTACNQYNRDTAITQSHISGVKRQGSGCTCMDICFDVVLCACFIYRKFR